MSLAIMNEMYRFPNSLLEPANVDPSIDVRACASLSSCLIYHILIWHIAHDWLVLFVTTIDPRSRSQSYTVGDFEASEQLPAQALSRVSVPLNLEGLNTICECSRANDDTNMRALLLRQTIFVEKSLRNSILCRRSYFRCRPHMSALDNNFQVLFLPT